MRKARFPDEESKIDKLTLMRTNDAQKTLVREEEIFKIDME